MTVGSAVLTNLPSVGVDQCNAKMILEDIGSACQSAPKKEGGQLFYSLDTSGKLLSAHYYSLDKGKKVLQSALAAMLYPAKFGVLFPRAAGFATSADGIIDQSATSGTVALAAFDATFGDAQTFTTVAAGGSAGGYNHNRLHTMRDWNPILKVIMKNSVSSNLRFFVGWISQTGNVGNVDDPLNVLSGFGIAKITTQANLRVAHNDGVSTGVYDDTGIAAGTGVIEIELWGDGNGNQFWWSINKSTPVAVTTDIPAATTQLSKQITLITTAAAGIVLSVYNEFYNSGK